MSEFSLIFDHGMGDLDDLNNLEQDYLEITERINETNEMVNIQLSKLSNSK